MVGGRRYKCTKAVDDSGAEETVAPRGAFPGRARTSATSRAGAYYRTASGAPTPNLEELDQQFLTSEGYPAEIPFELADVERPFIAVSALAKAAHLVEFNDKGSEITHHSGKVTSFERRGSTCVLGMWVPIKEEETPAPFHWQGSRRARADSRPATRLPQRRGNCCHRRTLQAHFTFYNLCKPMMVSRWMRQSSLAPRRCRKAGQCWRTSVRR